MDACVFIHTNSKQGIGARVAAHAVRRASRHNDRFHVRILCTEDYAFINEFHRRPYLRNGERRIWRNDDLQSFTPLRFMPPELMEYRGRAVVMDPDVFARADIWQLLSRPMTGAIGCRTLAGERGLGERMASSVMLLDCARLSHWRCEEQFRQLFRFERDYTLWIRLQLEDPSTLEPIEPQWNDFDRLADDTKMVHNTARLTQPWKTGLPVDFRAPERGRYTGARALSALRRRLFGEYAFSGRYRPHPDPRQEAFFFGLLRECVEAGTITEDELRREMSSRHIRPDALEVMDRVPPVD
ncbi:MAG: hypothetical protein MI919_16235 [Holophagales bacterium]|nr:hypothetical protein [Holophagales bacterium]